MPDTTRSVRRRAAGTVALLAASVLASTAVPAAGHVPRLQIERADLDQTPWSRTLSGSVLLHAADEHTTVRTDPAGDATGGSAAPPGTDLLSSTVRPQTPDLAEFILRTSPADIVVPDGTVITPGGTTILYTWDVTTGLPAPRHRFQVQARRPTSTARTGSFVLLSDHDGTAYARQTPFDGTFTRDSVSWQLDATGNFVAVSGDPQQQLPLTLSVSNTALLTPGGPVPTAVSERQALDHIDAFAHKHPQASARYYLADLLHPNPRCCTAERWETHLESFPLVRGTEPGDVQQGRYTYTVELPAPDFDGGLQWYQLAVGVAYVPAGTFESNWDHVWVCGEDSASSCPLRLW